MENFKLTKKKTEESTVNLENSYNELIRLFTEVSSTDDMKALFEDMFTDAEIKDFTIRWKLMNDLYEHVPQRTIARNLKISLCRITRGSKMLKKKNGYIKARLSEHYDDHLHI